MNVYFVMSEELSEGGGYYEPPEYYNIVEIVAARNNSQARYLAYKKNQNASWLNVEEIPRFVTKKLGEIEGGARILVGLDADHWYRIVPDGIKAPS